MKYELIFLACQSIVFIGDRAITYICINSARGLTELIACVCNAYPVRALRIYEK